MPRHCPLGFAVHIHSVWLQIIAMTPWSAHKTAFKRWEREEHEGWIKRVKTLRRYNVEMGIQRIVG